MGNSEDPNLNNGFPEAKKGRIRNFIAPAVSSFIVQIPRKLQGGLKARIEGLANRNQGRKTVSSSTGKKKGSSRSWEFDLDKQLEVWKQNPSWVDETPKIKVSTPRGSLCNLNVEVNVGLPPAAVYNIVTDPDNRRVFKNIKEVISRKVLIDEGSRQVVELEQAAIWKFLWWSGTISVHVLVEQNREDYSMNFKQIKTGFMKRFEGCWKVEPLFVDEQACGPLKPQTFEEYHSYSGGRGRIGSKVKLDQLIQPAVVPPPPISWYLRGITTRTTEMLIYDLLAEAKSIRGGSMSGMAEHGQTEDSEGKTQAKGNVETQDIKETWRLSRKKARRYRNK